MTSLLATIIAIWRKELQTYFASPFAYTVAGIFWLISGFFFVALLLGPQGIIAKVSQGEQQGVPMPSIDVAYIFLNSFFEVIGSIVLFILPLLSMGLYADERKLGTLELLATSPITNSAVAIGKLLGVVSFFTILILPMVLYEAIAFSTANPPIQLVVPILAHFGLILMATAVLSLGMFFSSLTNSSILAAILTFAMIIVFWLIDPLAETIGGEVGQILGHLSLLKHYDNFIKGIFDSSSLLILLSYSFLGLFLTVQYFEVCRYYRR